MKNSDPSVDVAAEVAELQRLLTMAEANVGRSRRLAKDANRLADEASRDIERIKSLLAERKRLIN